MGGGGLSEFVKKKICDGNFVSDNFEWSFKNLWKTISSADVKANKNNKK